MAAADRVRLCEVSAIALYEKINQLTHSIKNCHARPKNPGHDFCSRLCGLASQGKFPKVHHNRVNQNTSHVPVHASQYSEAVISSLKHSLMNNRQSSDS